MAGDGPIVGNSHRLFFACVEIGGKIVKIAVRRSRGESRFFIYKTLKLSVTSLILHWTMLEFRHKLSLPEDSIDAKLQAK